MSKDRSKEILREIQSLRRDIEERLDRLEAASGKETKPGPSVQETEVSGAALPVRPKTPVVSVPPTASAQGTPLSVSGPGGSPRPFTVVVRPLVDLSLAKAVESSLSDADGIDQVRLRALSGDSAVIDASVSRGVSVVSALRRGLPVAFDVTEADEGSVSIELARPESDPDESQAGELETEA